ncbi:TonB-linked SusC/RagA family outer membrane protein [Filimonas zeae]|uniref:SusC/RagA family TonB-linked outer membrane protein n=1 Tax=Filimonas zeae TaxID=1737353 RepID=A0A917J6V9_9BACT|nr:SusC/RagA family TonB-linked outer membrane protein [Filimonas zeae]MDR6342608.1 TonB-linked SusC/RagA family outer membrane protein [Filimonas zeae]GGH81984.1 SusC/RagA family TonB-linked outer membrane protein [Filimonas zeae]
MNKRRMRASLLVMLLSGVAQAQDSTGSKKDDFNLLFHTQAKKKTTAAVAELYDAELQKTFSTSFQGILSGRATGVYTIQTNGAPGNDDVGLLIRGQAPLVMIDGTPQSFNSINPEQIESITILKDAVATAMMGFRGSNSIVQITTKKGYSGPQRIEFTAFSGFSRPTVNPKPLNAYNYATLYNEALTNDGRLPVYSQADLDAFRTGSDPIGHPDVNWQSEVMKKQSAYSRYDLQISGGTEMARYYVDLDYLSQPGLFKTSADNSYNTNADYKRYIFRSNVAVDFNKYISTGLNLFGRIQNTNQPGVTTATLYNNIINIPANAYPIFNSNGSLAGSQDFTSNIYGATYKSGYRPGYERDFKVDLYVKAKLDGITKGLWIRGAGALNGYLQQNINRSKAVVVYQQRYGAAGDTSYKQFGTTQDQANGTTAGSQNRLFYTELSMGYNNSFGKNNIDVLVLANNDYRMINSDLPYNVRGVSGKVSYNYDGKYMVDVAAGYTGSERYAKNHRYGLFPAVGLGWNLTKESFLAGKTSWINYLKLRASYGITGNFNPGYYAYNQYYITAPDYNLGNSPTAALTVRQGVLANPNLSWEKAQKFNMGFDASLFRNSLDITVDYFNDKYYDLLQQIGNNTDITGANYGLQNIGKNRYYGVEVQLNYHKQAGAFHYFIAPNFTLQQSEVVYQQEVYRPYDYMQRTGRPVNQFFGYVADGLFQNAAEVNAAAKPSASSVVAGDIRYKDLNNDGVINANDQTAIGTTAPLLYYGLHIGSGYKGFDIAVLFQGAANRNIYLGNSYYEFQGGHGQAFEHHLDRWTPQNTGAMYPRLAVGTSYNNQQVSSYWVRSGNYTRVKSIELGYALPATITKLVHMQSARIFVNATNLFTFTSLKDVDPENYTYLYPIQKMVNLGINIKF